MPRPDPNRPPSIASIQREAVERLKASLFGVDPYVRRRYITDFHREFRSYRREVSWEALVLAAYRSNVIFIGDYHALSSCQEFAARLLAEMARRRKRVILAVEMVFGRHQAILDRYQANDIDDAEFRRRIRYEQDWGYPWTGYATLFATARRLGVSVIAADAEPRGGLATIKRRDAHAGRRIASLFDSRPRPQVMVLFGESHLARGHLPLAVARSLEALRVQWRPLVIVQNVESIYWQLAERGLEQTEVVEVAERKYAVFNASPLAKYEAYRQTLDRWRGDVYDDGSPDLTPTVHHIIDTILEFLGIDPYRYPMGSRTTAVDFLVDVYPDVFPVEDAEELLSILRAEGIASREAAAEAARMAVKGSLYVAAANSLFIRSFDLRAGAEEATRFIRIALVRRVGGVPAGPSRAAESEAGLVLEEALGFLGSKVIDPSRRPEDRSADADLPTASGRSAAGPGPPTSGERGRRLGQKLYEAYHTGQVSRRQIVALFRRDLSKSTAARSLLNHLELVDAKGARATRQTSPRKKRERAK